MRLLLVAPLALALVACANTDPAPSQTASAASPDRQETSVLPPVMVDESTSSLLVDVGATLNVTSPDATRISSSDEAVLATSQPYSDGSAQFNAGARALSAGQALLVVYGGADEELYRVTVTVQQAAASPSAAGLS